MRRFLKLAIPLLVLSVVAVTAGYLFIMNQPGRASHAQIFLAKATGKLPDLSWVELWAMTRRPGSFSLDDMFRVGSSLDGSLANSYTEAKDLEAGEIIFRSRCAGCHGAEGKGLHAPALNRPGLKNGDSDLSIYKVLRDGIPNTEMVATDLSFVERWQLVGYLRKLQLQFENPEGAAPQLDIPKVTSQQIESPETRPDEWLTYSGSLSGWRYSPLAEITPENASKLRVRWIQQFRSEDPKNESSPLVIGNLIFITVPPATVIALDAKTGNIDWKYERRLPNDLPVCCGRVNRGLAILGDTLFFGSFDGYLIALDARNGKVIWQTQVAKSSDGYSMTGAPLVIKDSVIVGVAGGEFEIRGLLAAYDPKTGQRKWKFDTIPAPGDFGHETWTGDAWRTGGGSTWVTGGYDPSLNLLYWGVGNPSPPFTGDTRPGDNLFTNSVIALNASTGKLAWHFQFTPHDENDWDSAQTPILADVSFKGLKRKVICWANRNGFYYVLDRATGEFLLGTPFVEQTWADGLSGTGRPILSKDVKMMKGGRLLKPGVVGGMNWQPAAFDPIKGLVFVPAIESSSVFTKADPDKIVRGNSGMTYGSGGSTAGLATYFVRGLDVATGERRWEFRVASGEFVAHSGLLATAGGLVFGSSSGTIFALDSATGREVWRLQVGGPTLAPPISFKLEGRQVIGILAGHSFFVFGL